MSQYTLFLILAPISIVTEAVVLVWLIVSSQKNKQWSLVCIMIAGIFILAMHTLELLARTETDILFFSRLGLIGVIFIPVFWLNFAIEQCGYPVRNIPRLWGSLLVIPVTSTIVVLFEPHHTLLWLEHAIKPVDAYMVNVVIRYGSYFWVHFSYCYLLFLCGSFLLLREFVGHHKIYRQQTTLIIVGVCIPFLFNVIYIFRLVPGWRMDFSSIVFVASSVCFALAVSKYGFGRVKNLPRGRLMELLDDGLIVVDTNHRIVDINQRARNLCGPAADRCVGHELTCLNLGFGPDFPAESQDHARFDVHPGGASVSDTIEIQLTVLRSDEQDNLGYCLRLNPKVGEESGSPRSNKVQNNQGLPLHIYRVLSVGERRIAELVVQGRSNKEIAESLELSENTVKTHVRNVLRKTRAPNRNQLSVMCFK